MKVRLVLRRSYGDLEVEADSFDELINSLREFPEWSAIVDGLVSSTTTAEEQKMLAGVVEYTKEGPTITVPKEKLTNKEAIGLLLYSKEPEGLKPQEVGHLLSLSGFLSLGYGSRLSELRREGQLYKEGDFYRLTAQGKRWIEGLASSIQEGGAK